MAKFDDLEERLQVLEARLPLITFVGGPFLVLNLINLGVSLWYFQQDPKPDWDFIAVTLTVFEIFLVVALIGGFWTLRSAAQVAARTEARKIAREVAEKEARTSILAWADLLDNLEETGGAQQDMVGSFAEEEGDEQRT